MGLVTEPWNSVRFKLESKNKPRGNCLLWRGSCGFSKPFLCPRWCSGRADWWELGTELFGFSCPLAGSLELAMTHPEFYWYVDEGLSVDNLKSSLLRSEILFGAPLPNYYSVDDRWEEQRAKFQSFVVTYVAMLAKQSTR
jgi:hypothetical protein